MNSNLMLIFSSGLPIDLRKRSVNNDDEIFDPYSEVNSEHLRTDKIRSLNPIHFTTKGLLDLMMGDKKVVDSQVIGSPFHWSKSETKSCIIGICCCQSNILICALLQIRLVLPKGSVGSVVVTSDYPFHEFRELLELYCSTQLETASG